MSLHIFSKQTKIDFVGMRHYAYGLSALLILVGLITIFMNGGLRYGVDFAGGAAVQLQFEKPVADEDIKNRWLRWNCPAWLSSSTARTGAIIWSVFPRRT